MLYRSLNSIDPIVQSLILTFPPHVLSRGSSSKAVAREAALKIVILQGSFELVDDICTCEGLLGRGGVFGEQRDV